MKDFLFKAEQARTPVRELSGGERARLILARVLSRPANLLVLDEPTNDLDMETLELLQELVAGFAGTVILVSHDRDFLDRTVTSIIAPDGGGRWIEYAGGYSDMLAQRGGTKLEDRKSAAKLASASAQSRRQRIRRRPVRRRLRRRNSPSSRNSRWKTCRRRWRPYPLRSPRWRTSSPIRPFTSATRRPSHKTIAALDKERQTLAALEEEWLELEMLREELEG